MLKQTWFSLHGLSKPVGRTRNIALAIFVGVTTSVVYLMVDTLLHDLYHPLADVFSRVIVGLSGLFITLFIFKLKYDERRFEFAHNAVENAGDGVFWLNISGQIIYANDSACNYLGYSREELIGKFISKIDPSIVEEKLNGFLRELKHKGLLRIETMHRSKSGSVSDVELVARLISLEGESYVCAIARDISDRKRAELATKTYAEKLKESNRLKDLFTDILRHDLINPASAVKSSSELLAKIEGDETKKKIIDGIFQSSTRIIDMCESASRYAKVASVERIELGYYDLSAIISDVLKDFENQLVMKGLKVEYTPRCGCTASVNPLISDVFVNIISNAIKYSHEGKSIEISISEKEKSWLVSIKDYGEGILNHDKQRIFTRFERLGKEGVKGTGLGLAIAKQIVDLHGGKIWVEDNPIGGSIFFVELSKSGQI
ncbi:MAG: ATP-binding protein [Bdellovibrionota bacterium]